MVDTSKIKSDRIEDGIEPGDICYSLRTSKTGWLLCDGSSYQKSDYPNLFNEIGYKFGGSENNFNVPNYKGKFLQMINDDQEIGQEMEIGLPNIIGETIVRVNSNSPEGGNMIHTNNVNGAFKEIGLVCSMNGGSAMTMTAYKGTFDASLSNSIYGNSDTVQPPSSLVNYFIKY